MEAALRSQLHTNGTRCLSSEVINPQLCTHWGYHGCTDGSTLQKKEENEKRVTLFKFIFRLKTYFFPQELSVVGRVLAMTIDV